MEDTKMPEGNMGYATKKRVLVVDDSRFMRRTVMSILKNNNCDIVGEAENGKIAVEKYKELMPDLVTLDITMQGVNGLEALSQIISYDSGAKVVMVSAMGQSAIVQDAIKLGAKGFLVKPFKEKDVAETISRL